MATNIHLIRHGHHPLLGRVLCGRMSNVELDDLGRQQMMITAEAIRLTRPHWVHSSPQIRALQSAAIIAVRCSLSVEIVHDFDEIDMGSWTGAGFADLEADSAWRIWNEQRGRARPPGGESMAMLQQRVVSHIERLRGHEGRFVIVTHAEPIRAVLLHYLNVPLDDFESIEVDPASISTISLEKTQAYVSCVNGKVMA